MHVIATAGHVDHGKSTLVRTLTGMEPDRWAEERRRGLTIDLGFAWTQLAGRTIAFVDVPGHERFVPNMLAGIGPVPAVLFVVAADEGWMPQSGEHLAALDALSVRHGLLVVTKVDRADPGPALAQARHELDGTTLAGIPAVTVSSHTGTGLAELRDALTTLTGELSTLDIFADVRLWIDRSFTIRGAGTVVTGTLTGGTLRVNDELALTNGEHVHVRGLQALGEPHSQVPAVARVAVNLRGAAQDSVRRGGALLTPGAWRLTSEVDVRLQPPGALPRELALHTGTAAVLVHARPLGNDFVRLTLARALPLRVHDRGLLRDPGAHRIAAGFDVLEVWPPPLSRRGAARSRAEELAAGQDHLRGRGFVPVAEARKMGWPLRGKQVGEWLVHVDHWQALRARADTEVRMWLDHHPLAASMPLESLRQTLDLPTLDLALAVQEGMVQPAGALPEPVEAAVRLVEKRVREKPFQAPDANELRHLGLGKRELAAAIRLGRLIAVADGVVLAPDAYQKALTILTGLDQPFTVSEVRRALDTTRRVAIPLLETLDRLGHTTLRPDGRRTCSALTPDRMT